MFPEVFDSSILAKLKSCPTDYHLTYEEDWKPKGLSVHLHAGGAFAYALEVTRRAFYIDGLGREAAIEKGVGALLTKYGDFEAPSHGSGSAKTAERMAGAFVFYWDHYPLNHETAYPILLPGGDRAVEFSFAHPLPIDHPETGNPILYAGRMDAILSYANGVFIFDEKTTSSLGPTWGDKWDLRSQFTGYCWGARESGIPVNGVVVRGVSILKTKYETQEAITYRPDHQINRWYVELLHHIERAKEWYKRGEWFHALDDACESYGGCPFKKVCMADIPEPYLESYFERRHWDPVTRKETLR